MNTLKKRIVWNQAMLFVYVGGDPWTALPLA